MILFVALAIVFFIVGIVVGLYSLNEVYTTRFTEEVIVFFAY